MVFTDGFEQFWDGLYVDAGDVRRDVRVSYRKELGHCVMAIDIATSAGTATPARRSVPTSDEGLHDRRPAVDLLPDRNDAGGLVSRDRSSRSGSDAATTAASA